MPRSKDRSAQQDDPEEYEVHFYNDRYPPEQQLFSEAYSCWKGALEEFRIEPGDITQDIQLTDVSGTRTGDELTTWVPAGDVVRIKHLLQQGTNIGRFDQALSRLQTSKINKGEQITAEYLAAARGNQELTGAILLEASLFARMGSRRAQYPSKYWPKIHRTCEARESILHLIGEELPGFDSWPHLCTSVLPVRSEDWWYEIKRTYHLWRFLAEEHARLYAQYRVLTIRFVAEGV